MPTKAVATARVEGGRVDVRRRDVLVQTIRTLKDGEYKITFERIHAKRSAEQNAYYHAVVVPRVAEAWSKKLGRQVGLDEAHELIKAQFLPHATADGRNGTLLNGFVIGGSTAKLNKLEFVEFLEAIVGWAAEHWDCYIEDPNPDWRAEAEQAARLEAAKTAAQF
jgi:hypothetical protein